MCVRACVSVPVQHFLSFTHVLFSTLAIEILPLFRSLADYFALLSTRFALILSFFTIVDMVFLSRASLSFY